MSIGFFDYGPTVLGVVSLSLMNEILINGKKLKITKRVYLIIREVLGMKSDIDDHQKVKLEFNLSKSDLVSKMTLIKSRSRKII